MSNVVLQAQDVRRDYTTGDGVLSVLKGVNFTLHQGEMVALVGPSGAGKSTLLHVCGLLDSPSSGTLMLMGQNVGALTEQQRTLARRQQIGFVYQFHHLLPEFTALENVAMPQLISGASEKAAHAVAAELLGMVGLSARHQHRPAQLSGGEQQRVAICRALANKPRLLIADEPTGNLDPHTGAGVFDLFKNLARSTGVTTLMATHNMELARQADRILSLADGCVR